MAITMRVASLTCAALALAMTASAQLSPAEEGRRLYLANNCYGCHGGRVGGGSFGGPQFREEKPERDNVSDAMREGEDRMPAFPNLYNDTDINNLYAYFQSLRTPSEPTFTRWWEPVPLAKVQRRTPRLYAASRKTDSRAEPIRLLASFISESRIPKK